MRRMPGKLWKKVLRRQRPEHIKCPECGQGNNLRRNPFIQARCLNVNKENNLKIYGI